MADKRVCSTDWIKADKGIRYRIHPTRKHGVKPDMYFVIRYTTDGKEKQEALGWASEGMTLAKARVKLEEIREAKRSGKGAKTLAEQRAIAEAEHRAFLKKRDLEQNQSTTFGDFWLNTYWPSQSHKARGSLTAEHHLWEKWIKPVLESKPFSDIHPSDLELIRNRLINAGRSPSTIKYAMAVISQTWTMAKLHGVVDGDSPTKLITLPKRDNKRQRYLSKKECDLLLLNLKSRSQTVYVMAVLAIDCGLRFGEIAALSWEDCDFGEGNILIRDPKSSVNRYAFMTKRVKKVLIELQGTAALSGLIFIDKNGNKLTRISNTFRVVADSLFNESISDRRLKVCFHTLRHTFASRLVSEGVSLYEVRELMGHSDFSMTQRYSHLSPEGLRKAIQILDD